jgi:hypothetical protein
MLEENTVGIALTQSQVSHYEPRTNRCYIAITVQTANMNVTSALIRRSLYDGQTKELLAWTSWERGRKAGMVYDKQHKMTTWANGGWDDADAYIEGMMADDRR